MNKQPFSVNTIDLNGKRILVRPEVADNDKGKGILVGDPRVIDESRKILLKKSLLKRH